MIEDIVDLEERRAAVDAIVAEFRALQIGQSVVYHTGVHAAGLSCRAALEADRLGLAVLFQRPVASPSAGLREFDFILIRCSAKAHAALRYRAPFRPRH